MAPLLFEISPCMSCNAVRCSVFFTSTAMIVTGSHQVSCSTEWGPLFLDPFRSATLEPLSTSPVFFYG